LQTGFSPDKNLPDEWDPRAVGKNNLIWKQPYACRSTPLVMNGRVYVFGADNEPLGVPTTAEKKLIGERVTCLDAAKGTKVWEQTFNVFHSDIVANRLGWAPLAGDAENKRVYAHTTGGFLFCFDAESGKIVWQRQLTEEFGRFTGYGGRVGGGPIFDQGLVFVGFVSSSWGDKAIGTNRMYAFDGKTGQVVWIADAPNPFKSDTYYSNPVIAVINGQRLLISGGADGALTAYQARTGKVAWTIVVCSGAINPSPVVDGNLVYIAHGEENPEGGGQGLGRVICVDGSQVTNGKPKVVWDYRRGVRFGLASLAIHDGKLYVPDDGAKLYCFDAKKGTVKWKYNYGTTSRGAPVIADGKIYLSETVGRFYIIKLKEDGSEPDADESNMVKFRPRQGAGGTFVESNSTPSIADGRIYLATRDEVYCIGKPDWQSEVVKLPPMPPEATAGALTQLQLFPADANTNPNGTLTFEVRGFDANGVPVKDVPTSLKWSLPEPPIPKGLTKAPPALEAKQDGNQITVSAKPSQQGYVEAATDDGKLKARARVRVAPKLPYTQDFEKVPVGAVPGGWVNTQGKFRVVELKEADGTTSKVLFKVNTNPAPPVARSLGYITTLDATGYTIESDMMSKQVRGKLGDMGLCANRYLLILDGKPNDEGKRELRLTTWEALPTPLPAGRVAAEKVFDWKPNVWYRAKLTVEVGEKEAIVRGKVWERGQQEPAAWTIELKDPRPNREGAAALYGYVSNAVSTDVPGAEIYYDNVVVTPNGKN
jgi:outer membrane protein assembly factor BamB